VMGYKNEQMNSRRYQPIVVFVVDSTFPPPTRNSWTLPIWTYRREIGEQFECRYCEAILSPYLYLP
jgi:hypothetical protein